MGSLSSTRKFILILTNETLSPSGEAFDLSGETFIKALDKTLDFGRAS